MADEQTAGREGLLHGSSPLSGEGLRAGRGSEIAHVAVVSEDGVRRALRHDQGSEAHLISWSRHDFTNKGDNYVAEVTSVSVQYRLGTHTRHASYVLKMRRSHAGSHFDDMVFLKEGKFYTVLLPLLNSELTSAGQEPLRVPRCLHDVWEDHDSQLFLEDLRLRHFKMYDRKKPLSMAHASLTVRELARLHAASVMMLSRQPRETPPLNFLSWDMSNYSQETNSAFEALISGSLQTAGEVAGAAGRKDMQEWFSSLAPRGPSLLTALTHLAPPFDVIGHGDCWVNNLLFREDSEGKPVEVMLVDFQLCRRSSPALDLNYLLFSSLTAAQRSTNLTHLLATYYSSFRAVLTAAVPALICDGQDAREFDFKANSGDHAGDYVLKKRERALRMVTSNPLMRPRLLSLYEDVSRHAPETSMTLRGSEYLSGKSLTVPSFMNRRIMRVRESV
ncbi:uncharacterized protein LOC126993650 [Eriocheir sinensis]|uniref:uncharacterized protein LOC126993650 n=1 Tax=Eriocheir sinensis TaxID=95602 RepID=UPI0021CAB2F5|nr:uncharacterized protein LOC126993650 [Eriocheir sinensis]